mgnify:CR=1 FL=1
MRTVTHLNNARRYATFEEARDAAATCGYPSARVEAFPRGYFVAVPGPSWGGVQWLATDELIKVQLL